MKIGYGALGVQDFVRYKEEAVNYNPNFRISNLLTKVMCLRFVPSYFWNQVPT